MPYKNDLSARINEQPFRAEATPAIVQKLHLIRKAGNAAVHEQQPIAPAIALGVLRELHHVDDAVSEGFLVPAVGISCGTKFLQQGIRYADLSDEEKDEWDASDWGEAVDTPDAVTSEELNKFLFNEDTVDKVHAELMAKGHRVASGDRLGKTIVFAKNQAHAEFIAQRFDLQYPEYAGHFARVITHGTPYAQSLIDDFSVPDKAPHIAISVDMLDTGIDVPEVVNLVFFKLVRSKTKFWQMIGRGTRLRPDLYGPGLHKQNFYVFDFCSNLEFFSQDLPGSQGSLQKSLNQRLFETRLGLITALDHAQPPHDPDPPEGQGVESDRGLRVDTAWSLHRIVVGMNLDNFLVRPHRRLVEQYANWDSWPVLTTEAAGDVAEHLAGLPSTYKDDDEDAKRFDLLILRRQLAQLEGDAVAAERLREQIQLIAAGLLNQTAIPSVKTQQALLDEVAGDDWWVDVTLPMLELARLRLRGLLRFLERAKKVVVYTDFQDELGCGDTRRPARHHTTLPAQSRRVPQAAPGPHRVATAAAQQAADARRSGVTGKDAHRQRNRRR
jgi:type I restriction enzyme R subunit